ncbi:MAG: ferritin [Lentisphaeria bacterium]|nr:ferritin [Lentisphaeria bacterium]
MALKKEVESVLNKQLDKEFDASVVYRAMAIYFDQELLKGLAAWFLKQSAEERSHAEKIIGYMMDRGGSPVIPATKAPKMAFDSSLAALEAALAHERANTAGIYDCLETAQKVGDPATVEMLQWFIKEQVEEEQWAEEYTQMLERVQKSVGALYGFDHQVAKAAAGD